HQLLDLCLPGAPHQVVQERLIGINAVNRRAQFLRKRDRLTARTATGIDDDTKLLFREQAQDVQGMGVAAGAELFHPAEEQTNRVVGVHVLLGCLAPQGTFLCSSVYRRTRGMSPVLSAPLPV